MMSALDEVGRITDVELVCRLERLVKADQALSAKLLVHLGEVEARGLHLERGYGSMFEYCTHALGMSDAEAYARIHVARLGRRFPLVVEHLGAGDVHLTALKMLAPHFTPENHVHLLDCARGKTKRQIEVLIAELAPKPDVTATVRKVPEARSVANSSSPAMVAVALPTAHNAPVAQSVGTSAAACGSSAADRSVSPPSTFVLQPPQARASCKPLSPGRYELKMTLKQEAYADLEQLVELFRHHNPSGDLAHIVARALRELRERTMKRRFAQTDKAQSAARKPAAPERVAEPRPQDVEANNSDVVVAAPNIDTKTMDGRSETAGTAAKMKSGKSSRYIPRAIMREVHARDLGQCTFVSAGGRRCAGRGFLEVHHHTTTFARGGDASAENLRLTCRAHNLFFATQDYGRRFMRKKIQEAQARQTSTVVARGQGLLDEARAVSSFQNKSSIAR